MEAHRQKKITTEAHRYRDTEERKRINHGGTETRSEITTEAQRHEAEKVSTTEARRRRARKRIQPLRHRDTEGSKTH